MKIGTLEYSILKKKQDKKDEQRKSHKRDKSLNTPEFNRKWKARRKKAKFDAKGRKINQRVRRR